MNISVDGHLYYIFTNDKGKDYILLKVGVNHKDFKKGEIYHTENKRKYVKFTVKYFGRQFVDEEGTYWVYAYVEDKT